MGGALEGADATHCAHYHLTEESTMKRNLQSVAVFTLDRPFSEGQVRWWIFNAEQNGLADADALVRIQRRVYIDIDAFDRWIESQNRQQAPANRNPSRQSA